MWCQQETKNHMHYQLCKLLLDIAIFCSVPCDWLIELITWMEQRENTYVKSAHDHTHVCWCACLSCKSVCFYSLIQVNMRWFNKRSQSIVRDHCCMFPQSHVSTLSLNQGVPIINLYPYPHIQYVLYMCMYECKKAK